MTAADFYEYWLNAHVTLPARFPGISSIWLHVVSFDDATWPHLPGVSHRPPSHDEFQGVPEATFVTMEGLAEFQASSKVQMDDGVNFLQEMIAYRSIGDATQTVIDRTGVPAPDGHDGLLRHLLFLRRRENVPAAEFRRFVADTLAPALAASPEVGKLRRHVFDEVEVTLDHPGVRMSRPLDRQYQAALAVIPDSGCGANRRIGPPRPGHSPSASPRWAVLGGGGMAEQEESAVFGGGGIAEQVESAVRGGGGMAEQESAVLGGEGMAEQEESAVFGGGGMAEQETTVLGGGGMAEQESTVLGGGGIIGPERAGLLAVGHEYRPAGMDIRPSSSPGSS
jgi:hypothetical protein